MKFAFLSMICFFCTGCLASVPVQESSLSTRQSRFVVEILAPGAFSSGGSIAVDPFLAGQDVASGPQLSRFSLMIVKGAAQTIADKGGVFSFCDPQSPQKADFFVTGRVEKFFFPGKVSGFLSGESVRIRVRAEIRHARTGDLLARLSAVRTPSADQRLLDFEAYDIGVSLAGVFLDAQ